ncbi:HEAT repeat domain-containing protein [Flavobacterium sufflavum]|uniref:HEAT repeat domain-containing protein n=1 Tax=Flavobacterium sufflavum TaxID=1921138 RepID=A0A437KXJ6_9FLAO|nr:HEAT repeat domain-containing protein [Flavobacterium sufflavum]RVT77341.1 HEAT repeat domain-containing protein [Flavobacterium sufflavum]
MLDFFQNSIDTLNNTHPIIVWCSYLSLTFIAIIIMLLIYLKNLRDRLRIKGRIKATYQKKYESDLIEYLYAHDDENISQQQQKIVNYLKKCSENRLKRKIIISTFLKLKNEISGETADAIQNLYYQTGLIDSATSKLKSKKWDAVARAIRELTQFEIKEAHDEILLLVNHPKKEVRTEIQKYLVKLFRFEGLEFLNVLENPLSEWDQIQLLEILNKFNNLEIPDMNNWLRSTNNSVVSFAIKLTKIYNQFGAKDDIIALFNHPNAEIRIEAINVVTHLGIYEAVEILKQDLFDRSLEEQIAFFKMMEEMSMPDDIPFIEEYVNHENFFIRISVMKIMNLITVDSDNTFKINSIDENYTIEKNFTKAS